MHTFDAAIAKAAKSLEHVAQLNARYRAGEVHVRVPEALRNSERTIEELVERHLPASHAALDAASRSLFFSLPVAFDPAESVGPYLAVIDRDDAGPGGAQPRHQIGERPIIDRPAIDREIGFRDADDSDARIDHRAARPPGQSDVVGHQLEPFHRAAEPQQGKDSQHEMADQRAGDQRMTEKAPRSSHGAP